MIIIYRLNEVFLSFGRSISTEYFLAILTIGMLIVCLHMLIENAIIYCLMLLTDIFFQGRCILAMYISFIWFNLLNL